LLRDATHQVPDERDRALGELRGRSEAMECVCE
jgi:hypothetical protein